MIKMKIEYNYFYLSIQQKRFCHLYRHTLPFGDSKICATGTLVKYVCTYVQGKFSVNGSVIDTIAR